MSFSANASAEANVIKIEGTQEFSFSPELTINWQKGDSDSKTSFPMRLLEGTSRVLNPAKYESRLAEARKIHTKSICDCYSLYKTTMPSLTDNQAFLLANGYMLSPGEADNITAILSESSANCPEDADPDVLDTQFKDQFIKGGSAAYDDEVRRIWSSLLSSELKSPGAFSKKTLNMLSSMDKHDVEAFKTLCSFSLTTPGNNRPSPVLTTINGEGWSYNGGGITVDDLGTLDAIGLIDKNTWVTYTLNPHSPQVYQCGTRCFFVKNRTNKDVKFEFGNALFLPSGIELSTLCEMGTSDKIIDLVEYALAGTGLDVELSFVPNEAL